MKYYKYEVLNIDAVSFSSVDLSAIFFESLKTDYNEFQDWFKSKQKSNESVFIYNNPINNDLEGLLYLKFENEFESYNSITPNFPPKRRLKIGTFKITKTGHNMGERFLKIIFDHAKINLVDEIYVTIINNNEEKKKLIILLEQYGFYRWGSKGANECVYLKKMGLVKEETAIKNYPSVNLDKSRFFLLPIKPEYHTKLLPDCVLKTESPQDYKQNLSWMNAIRKFYVGDNLWNEQVKENDILVFYRTTDGQGPAKYRSVMTGIGIVLGKRTLAKVSEETLLRRSVLTAKDIKKYRNPQCLEFLFLGNFEKRPTLSFLRENSLFNSQDNWGPRGIVNIEKHIFDKILNEANYELITK